MAKIDEYRQIVRDILTEFSQIKAANEEVEPELIFDLERDRYQLVHVGWSRKRRVYGCLVHLDISKDKVWIQHDGKEGGVANELVARGIPKHDIIIGFHSPFKRQFTEFAVG
jgi:hypothetical protein